MKNLKLKIIPAFTNYEDENTMTTWNSKKTYTLTKSFQKELNFCPKLKFANPAVSLQR